MFHKQAQRSNNGLQRICVFTDQMMMATSLMIASFRQSKKSLRAWPCCFMLPTTKPKHMEKTTRPRAFTPPEEPDTGTVSSTVSCSRNYVHNDWWTYDDGHMMDIGDRIAISLKSEDLVWSPCPTCMVCSTLLRFTLRFVSVTLRESVRFRVTVTFLVCTIFLYTVLYCKTENDKLASRIIH